MITPMTTAGRVAILGMAGFFPGGAAFPDTLWEALLAGRDLIEEVPPERWRVNSFHRPTPSGEPAGRDFIHPSRWGGFLRGIDRFDAAFFGIAPREAEAMDPAQRLLLKATWRCWEDAGLAAADWRERPVGVFVGGFTQDYQLLQLGDPEDPPVSPHTATGVMQTLLSNRISHCFHFTGPSMTIDTACSSSVVALHLAVESLRRGECELALVGAAQLQLAPHYTAIEGRAGLLSPSGRCRAFDHRADGYVRAESVAMVLLSPLDMAVRRGWRRRAEVVSTAVNHNGPVTGVTLPDPAAQIRLVTAALEQGGLSPDAVGYVEAHGTGTRAGDRAEAGALAGVFGGRRSGPLWIGSVKANMGHAEAAAGMAGLFKTVLSLSHRRIPPHLHWQRDPDGLDLAGSGLRLPLRPEPWPEHAPFAGVSAFGFGGTNAHAIVTAPSSPPPPPARKSQSKTRPSAAAAADGLVVRLSGPTRAHLPLQVEALRTFLDTTAGGAAGKGDGDKAVPENDEAVAALSAATLHRRSPFTHHLHLMASDRTDLRAKCEAYLAAPETPDWVQGEEVAGHRLVWIFAGMGPQWRGMGADLADAFPVYRDTLRACDERYAALSGISLLADSATADAHGAGLAPVPAQPLTLFLQIALARLLESRGVRADAAVGHSVGEIAAFHAAGAIDLATAVAIVHHRSRLQNRLDGTGGMLALRAAVGEAEALVAGHPGIALAAVNGPSSVTLSGSRAALAALALTLKRRRVPHRALAVGVAYHSAAMDGLEEEFRAALAPFSFRIPDRALWSTVTGRPVDEAVIGGDFPSYWWRNLRDTVLFAPAVAGIGAAGPAVCQEISAHPTLLATVTETIGAPVVATLHRGRRDRDAFVESLARWATLGGRPDWSALLPAPSAGAVATLPPYAWREQPYWSEAAGMRAFRLRRGDHPFLGARCSARDWVWEADIAPEAAWDWKDHKVLGRARMPAALLIEAMAAAMVAVRGTAPGGASIRFADLRFHKGALARSGEARLRFTFDPERGDLRVDDRDDGGRLADAVATTALPCASGHAVQRFDGWCGEEARAWSGDRYYDALVGLGHDYGPTYRCIETIRFDAARSVSRINAAAVAGLAFPPVLLDGLLQSLLFVELAARSTDGRREPDRVLGGIADVRLHHPITAAELPLAAATRLVRRDHRETVGDAVLTDARGRVIVELRGVTLSPIEPPSAFSGGRGPADAVLTAVWRPLPASAADHNGEERPGVERPKLSWRVLADEGGLGQRFADHLAARSVAEVRVCRSAEDAAGGDRVVDFRPLDVAGPPDRGDGERIGRLIGQLRDNCARLRRPSRLWLVTRAAFADGDAGEPVARSLWSAGRTVAEAERIEMFGGLVDLPASLPPDWCARLHDRTSGADSGGQFRLDGAGVWWEPGLEPAGARAAARPPVLRRDASYLVTGAFGALGGLVTGYLADHGARAVVLVGRRPLPPRDAWDDGHPEDVRRRIGWVRSLEQRGIRVAVIAADIAEPAFAPAVVGALAAQGLPPLRGIVHAAGAIADKALTDTGPADVARVLGPKVSGLHNLLAACDGGSLDFLLLYGSIASLLPAYGQAVYAAANGYLDGMADWLCRQGVPARALGWGPWTTGMGEEASLAASFRARGFFPLAPAEGRQLLDMVWSLPDPQLCLVAADWPALAMRRPPGHWLSRGGGPGPVAAAAPRHDLATLADAARTGGSPAARRALATDYLRALASRVMGISVDDLTGDSVLSSSGADSLMAVEIQMRIAADWSVDLGVADLLGPVPLKSLAEQLGGADPPTPGAGP